MNAAARTESPDLSATEAASRVRRVREDVKDGLAVIAVSAAVSSGLALVLLVLTGLVN